MIYKFAIVSSLIATAFALPAQAGTQAEYQALRNWCVERNRHQNDLAWKSAHNPQKYFHFQHYCFAMIAMDKIFRARNQQEVQYASSSVKGELGYVISHVPAEHFLMPEVYALRGMGEFLGHSNYDAEISLLRALQLDPNHVGALRTLVDLYERMNRKADAIKAIRAALAVAPEHKEVRRMAQELGLEVPEIIAREKKQIDAPSQPDMPATTAESKAATDTTAKNKATPISSETDTPKQDESKPVIGVPGNPYCRFCPDTVQP